jgi:hypothetical protein
MVEGHVGGTLLNSWPYEAEREEREKVVRGEKKRGRNKIYSSDLLPSNRPHLPLAQLALNS